MERESLLSSLPGADHLVVVRAVAIHGNLDVRLFKLSLLEQMELEVFDGDATFEPHAFVVGTNVGEKRPLTHFPSRRKAVTMLVRIRVG